MPIGRLLFLKQEAQNPKLRIPTLTVFGFVLIFSMFVGSFLFVRSASATLDNHPFISDPGTLLDGFEDVSEWTVSGTGATAENDVSTVKFGNQSIKVNTTNGNLAQITKTVNLDLSSGDSFSLWVYVGDISKIKFFNFYISSSAGWGTFFYKTFTSSILFNGWNELVFIKSQFTNSTTPDSWDNTIIRMRFTVTPEIGESVSVNFDDLRFGIEGEAKVIITFDDGKAGVINNAYPIMTINGQKGVTFIYTNVVGDSGIMTFANLTTLMNAGWDISDHTAAHKNLAAVSQEEMEADIDGGYDWLVANGFGDTAKFFAYPYGTKSDFNDAVVAKVKERHILARTLVYMTFPHFDILNYHDLNFKLSSYYVGSSTNVSTVQTQIDRVVEASGLLILTFHNIVDSGATGGEYLTADFQAISDYLKEKQDAGLLEVITFIDYYNALRPYVIGTDNIDIGAGATIYGDGRFVNTGTASGNTAKLSIVPTEGFDSADWHQWMVVDIDTWSTSDDYYKKWTETASGTLSVDHTVGDLESNKYYNVKVDGVLGADITGDNCSYGVCLSNSSGKITFTYTGTYSDHTFDVQEGDNTFPVRSSGSPSGTLVWDTTSVTLSLTTDENATCKYGVSSGTAYSSIANTFSTTGGTTHSSSITGLSSNNTTTYYVRCQDTVGNTNSDDYLISFSIAAGGGGGLPSAAYNPPSPPAPSPENPQGGFRIVINNGAETTNDRLVTLKLFAGSDTERMAISNNPDFTGPGTGQITYQSPYNWDLCYWQKECPDGVYTIYAKFYTQWGRASEVVSDMIVLTSTKPEVSMEPEISVEEMTVEEIKAKILQIKQQIIELLQQLIQLIQEQITNLQAQLP